jgi:hypothetical protein
VLVVPVMLVLAVRVVQRDACGAEGCLWCWLCWWCMVWAGDGAMIWMRRTLELWLVLVMQ